MKAPVLTPWERLIAGEGGYSCEPVRSTEVAQFYWTVDCLATEVVEACGLSCHTSKLAELAGPARMIGICCNRCDKPIFVFSRTDATDRVKKLVERSTIAEWADPSICKECQTDLYDRRDETAREKHLARERRRNELRFMPYREYLQTPEWRSRADQAKRAANYQCQTCASGGQLHVHHRTYAHRGEEHRCDLTVLCSDCHKLFHANRRLAEGGRATRSPLQQDGAAA